MVIWRRAHAYASTTSTGSSVTSPSTIRNERNSVVVRLAGRHQDVVRVRLGGVGDVGARRVGLGGGVRVVDDDRLLVVGVHLLVQLQQVGRVELVERRRARRVEHRDEAQRTVAALPGRRPRRTPRPGGRGGRARRSRRGSPGRSAACRRVYGAAGQSARSAEHGCDEHVLQRGEPDVAGPQLHVRVARDRSSSSSSSLMPSRVPSASRRSLSTRIQRSASVPGSVDVRSHQRPRVAQLGQALVGRGCDAPAAGRPR